MTTDINRDDRMHDTGDDQDPRTPSQRDRDRILYSPEFRRLAGISQVVHVEEGHIYHNRLTHSLKVAHLARRLTEYLIENHTKDKINRVGNLNPDVVEAAALAHDIGHPPFGHAAEQELQTITEDKNLLGSFEGNPQSFRIVNKVAIRRRDHPGMNFTRATLNAMLKYPWRRDEHESHKKNKWGYYHVSDDAPSEAGEKEAFDFAQKLRPSKDERSVEASIMDWADDVTYAIHDLDDFYRAGLIPLEELLQETSEQEEFIRSFEEEEEIQGNWDPTEFIQDNLLHIIKAARGIGAEENNSDKRNPFQSSYKNTRQEQASLTFLKSELIERYLGILSHLDVELEDSVEGNLRIDSELRNEVNLLKYITKYYVVEDPALVAQQCGHRRIISEIFEVLFEASQSDAKYANMISPPYNKKIERINEKENEGVIEEDFAEQWRTRVVIDMISTMTEQQAVNLYARIKGDRPGSVTDRIVY